MATLRPWKTVVNNAIEAYRSGQYVYFYGAKAIKLTEANMDYLISAEQGYFARYSPEELAQIKRNSLGKIGIDCSGFVGWLCTGDKQYSTGQINNCSRYNSLAAGPTGSILYTSWGGKGRHIGLDIGNGWCLQAGYESTDTIVKSGKDGIFLSMITETAWEKSGQSNVVNYSGAYSPYEPTTELVNEFLHPSKDPKWVAEATALVNVRTSPELKNDSTGKPLNVLTSWPLLGPGNLVDVCDEYPGWYYVRIAGKYYGYVASSCLKPVSPKIPEVGDHVRFTGSKIYVSSYSNAKGIAVPSFTGTVKQKNTQAHPYLVRSSGADGYEGWVNSGDLVIA